MNVICSVDLVLSCAKKLLPDLSVMEVKSSNWLSKARFSMLFAIRLFSLQDGRTLEFKIAVSKDEKDLAPLEPQSSKIFVAGVAYSTTDEQFNSYFSQFGEIESISLMRNKATGVSRGFGYVTFRKPSSVKNCLPPAALELDGRRLDIKPAISKSDMQNRTNSEGFASFPRLGVPHITNGYYPLAPVRGSYPVIPPYARMQESPASYAPSKYLEPSLLQRDLRTLSPTTSKKLFVAGLAASSTSADLRAHFETFGPVTTALVKTDQKTNVSRRFGFVVFQNSDSVDLALANEHVIDGKHVDIRRAVPKPNTHITPEPGLREVVADQIIHFPCQHAIRRI
jgi:RNA recognition motif-containing protein